MLYDRWRQIAREYSTEIALREAPTGRVWTFAQLDREGEAGDSTEPFSFPCGNSAEFVLDVIRAWRRGRIVCPVESGQRIPEFPVPPNHIVHLKVTSATTGIPKLVAFTAEQLAADAENIVVTMGLRHDWPNLGVISFAHSYGFSNLITPLLLHGVPLIIAGATLPEAVRRAAAHFLSITLAGVPALWRAWHDANGIPENVRVAISAGAPLPLALEKEIFAQRGLKIHNFYGATECGGIAYDRSETPRSDAREVGTAMQNVAIDVNAGGCLEVRGPNVGETYWPESSNALSAECYRTSDLADIVNGAIYLRGRASDLINVAGRKISPESIERLLLANSAVRDCLVFSVPSDDTQRGEAIVACVTAQNGTSADSLRTFLLERTDPLHVPREFWFVDSLEANQRGKLSRAEWRRKFLDRSKG